MFNHTMVYDGFRADDLREACAEITVWDHDRLRHHFIGGLRLGSGTGETSGTLLVWNADVNAASVRREELRRGRGLDGFDLRGGRFVAEDVTVGRRMGGGHFTTESVNDGEMQVRSRGTCP